MDQLSVEQFRARHEDRLRALEVRVATEMAARGLDRYDHTISRHCTGCNSSKRLGPRALAHKGWELRGGQWWCADCKGAR